MFRFVFALPVLIAACSPDQTVSAFVESDASYRLVEIDGAPYTASATIAFPEQGIITGSAPCNSFSATQSAPYPWLEIGSIRATRRACPNMDEETRFLQLLSEMTLVEATADVIIMRNDDGRELVFSAQ